LRAKTKLLIWQNPEHFGAALLASSSHRLSCGAAFSFERCLMGIFHHSFGFAPNAICFCLSHSFYLIINLPGSETLTTFCFAKRLSQKGGQSSTTWLIHSLAYLNLNVNPEQTGVGIS